MKIRVVDYNTGEEQIHIGVMSVESVNSKTIKINGVTTLLYLNLEEKFVIIEEM